MSDVRLPKRNVEVIANCDRIKHGILNNESGLPGYENISWCFINALAVGNVQITLKNKLKNRFTYREIPATANFMAVCTKAPSENYELKYIISLS